VTDPARLRFLLRWAYQQWSLETPTLGHSVSLTDAGGVPSLKAAAAAYLKLRVRSCWPIGANPTLAQRAMHEACGRGGCKLGEDDWEKVACRRDADGFYVTPLRAAMTRIRSLAMRRFLHDLVPNAMLRPSDVAQLHGTPGWAEAWVMAGALETLYREYEAAPRPRRSWVDRSTSQQNAEMEAVA
jgi:hypothetical protein